MVSDQFIFCQEILQSFVFSNKYLVADLLFIIFLFLEGFHATMKTIQQNQKVHSNAVYQITFGKCTKKYVAIN